jgi:recombination protein RecT
VAKQSAQDRAKNVGRQNQGSPQERAQNLASGPQAMQRRQAELVKPFREILEGDAAQAMLIESTGGNREWALRLAKIGRHALTRNPALLEAEPWTLVTALVDCAQLGLEPLTVLGHIYLIVYRNNRDKQNPFKEVTTQLGYTGILALAMRTQMWAYAGGDVICEGDEFDYNEGTRAFLYHKKQLLKRGDVMGAWAKLQPRDPRIPPLFKVVDLQTIHNARALSKDWGYWKKDKDAGKNPWKVPIWEQHYEAMCIKTAIRRMRPFLSLDPQLQAVVSLDEHRELGIDHGQRYSEAINVPVAGSRMPFTPPSIAPGTEGPDQLTGAPVPEQLPEAEDLNQPADPAALTDLLDSFRAWNVSQADLEVTLGERNGEPPLPVAEWKLGETRHLEALRTRIQGTPADKLDKLLRDEFKKK